MHPSHPLVHHHRSNLHSCVFNYSLKSISLNSVFFLILVFFSSFCTTFNWMRLLYVFMRFMLNGSVHLKVFVFLHTFYLFFVAIATRRIWKAKIFMMMQMDANNDTQVASVVQIQLFILRSTAHTHTHIFTVSMCSASNSQNFCLHKRILSIYSAILRHFYLLILCESWIK